MRFDQLIEDAESDVEINNTINQMVWKVVKAASDPETVQALIKQAVEVEPDGGQSLPAFRGSILGWPEPFDQVALMFMKLPFGTKGQITANKFDKLGHLLMINTQYGEDDDIHTIAAEGFRSLFGKRDTLTHELVHAYQMLVQDVPMGQGSPTDGSAGPEYINQPIEVDARFRPAISNITDVIGELQKAKPEDRQDIVDLYDLGGSYQDIMRNVIYASGNREWKALKPQRQRSMQKRVYGLYQVIQQLLSEGSVTEDAESDISINGEIEALVEQARRAFNAQVKKRTWNADRMQVTFRGNPALRVWGRSLGWEAPFDTVQLIIGHDPNNGGWYRGRSERSPHPIVFVSALLDTDFQEGWDWYGEALSSLNPTSNIKVLFHELVHAYQDLVQGTVKDIKHPDSHGFEAYYNSPAEFDARFRVIIRDYEKVLRMVNAGADRELILKSFEIDPDFRTQLAKLQDEGQWDPSGGYLWAKALPENKKKMIRRLYKIHEVLFNSKTPVTTTEDDTGGTMDTDQKHQDALDQTGYWGTAGAGCLIMARDTGRILIPLRSEWVQEPGTWGTWGGAIDPGEDPKVACMREVEEEAGYNGPVNAMVHLYRFEDGNFRYDTFLAMIDSEFDPVLNWETERAEWIEVGQWPKPLHFGLETVLKDAGVQNKLGSAAS